MSITNISRHVVVPAVVGYVMIAETASFLFAALLHLGIPFSLGLTQQINLWAAFVEGLCGMFAAIGAYFVLRQKAQAWVLAVAAHVFSILGFLLGIIVTARAGMSAADFNGIYHRGMLAILVVMLLVLTILFTRFRQGRQA